MEYLVFAFSLFISYSLFADRRWVAYIFILRTILLVVIHYVYGQVIFIESDGLDPTYNDEIFFIRMVSSFDYSLVEVPNFLSRIIADIGTSHYYPFMLSIFRELVFDMPLFARLVNNLLVLFIIYFAYLIMKELEFRERDRTLVGLLVILSPSLLFFSSKVLRDIPICFLTTWIFYLVIKRRWIFMQLWILLMAFLRQHLTLSFLYSSPFGLIAKRKPVILTFLLGFAGLYLVNFTALGSFWVTQERLSGYLKHFVFSFMGLNFLIADEASFNVSLFRVYLQRILAFDTFVPQTILALILSRNILRIGKVHPMTHVFVSVNILYIYFYYVTGFTAARQVVIPFIPIAWIQVFYYLKYSPGATKSV